MEARGIGEGALIEGARRATLADLSAWTKAAQQVLVF
jgi:sulfur relay (sulfurtransferase) complex TusBCD TusD component (DsrE family)